MNTATRGKLDHNHHTKTHTTLAQVNLYDHRCGLQNGDIIAASCLENQYCLYHQLARMLGCPALLTVCRHLSHSYFRLMVEVAVPLCMAQMGSV